MTIEMLDALIERLPQLRDQGVTHISVDPASGAVSMLIAPKPPAPLEQAEATTPEKPWDPVSLGLRPDTPRIRTFRERRATPAPTVK